MRILSYRTNHTWQEAHTVSEHGELEAGEGAQELRRALSEVFRCTNLVVLTGLGTSMHVNVDRDANARQPAVGKKIAPSMGDLWTAARSRDPAVFTQVLGLARFPTGQEENIETLLSYCRAASGYIDIPADRKTIDDFVNATEEIIRDMVRFVEAEDVLEVHAEFLRRLVRRSNRKARAKVFTTNYDLCFEYAARQGRHVIIDGFSHSTPQVFDSLFYNYDIVTRSVDTEAMDLISNVFHIYKLHGSVDWELNATTHEIERNPDAKRPLLVYPRNTKYELAFEQPYLEMMSALQAALRRTDTGLLIVGFGFNDNHITEPVLAAIRSNLSLQVVVCAPRLGQGMETTNAYIKKIDYLIRQGDARLALVGGRFDELVPHLPDIAAETDLEQHLERVRKLRAIDDVR